VAAGPSDMQAQGNPTVQVDGGDLGCGELLVLLYRRVRDEPAGTVVAVTTSDAAARVDLPAWCHLTGHHYLGPSRSDTYLVRLAERPRSVSPDRPWHRTDLEENR